MPAQVIRSTIPQMHVKVNGTRLPDEAYQAILEGIIESSLHLPDACTLRIHDHEFKWLDSDHWKEGNQILIEAGQGRDPLITVFEGEITTLEMDLAAMGVATLTVRCMDKAHRLHRGKKRQTFTKVKDSDIVLKLARENGFKTKAPANDPHAIGGGTKDMVDDTRHVHDWVIQNNQTDWEFMQFLAQRNGHRLYLEGRDCLCFKKVEDTVPKETELEWGKDLRSFRLRVNSSNQVNKVIVRSWDPQNKKSIVGQASKAKGAPKVGMRSEGGSTAMQAFGQAEMVIVDRPVRSQEEATKMAQSVCDDIGTAFIEADGLCYNHPELRPGHKVKLSNIGNRFNGSYIITTTTHTFSAAEGFTTQFVISGKEPATLMSILGGGGGGGGAKTPSKGSPNAGNIVIGIVTDNKDPLNQARVKVKFPALSEELATDWIRIAAPMAGPGRGFMFLPEVDDEVLVAFENGDVHQGYIIGCLWNGKDDPPLKTDQAVSGGKVRRRRIKSRIGHILDFDDDGRILLMSSSGEEVLLQNGKGIRIATPTEQALAMTDDGRIGIGTKMGKYFIASDKDKALQITDEMGNSISIDSASQTITIKANVTVNISSTGPMNITGAMVNINSGGGGAGASADKSDPMDNDKAE